MIELNNKHEFKELKERLFKYKENKAKLESRKLKLKRLDCNISPVNSGMPGASGGFNSKVEKYVVEKNNLEKEIVDLDFEINELEIGLNLLTKKEYDLLELRYFECYKPSEVYNTLHMSKTSFWREHNKALNKIEKTIKM